LKTLESRTYSTVGIVQIFSYTVSNNIKDAVILPGVNGKQFGKLLLVAHITIYRLPMN